ncbi:MAG TPA: TetR family transcriptional regulator [Acidimicrobiales bacterium]|nr:TetR family transcriptional regulator [Acidimicrobiales bacterium]
MVDAALAIFAEGGFEAASMAAIAARAEIAKSVLYDCFPGGKQELYEAVLTRVEELFTVGLDRLVDDVEAMPPGSTLAVGLAAFLRIADEHPEAFKVVFGGAGSADPNLAARVEQVHERIVGRIGQVIASRIGGDPDALETELFARSVVAIAEELARWIVREPQAPREELVELTAAWLINGVSALAPHLRS